MNTIVRNNFIIKAILLTFLLMSFVAQAKDQNIADNKDYLLDKLGNEFVLHASEQNFTALDKLFNLTFFAEKIAGLVFNSERDRAGFVIGFMEQIKSSTYSKNLLLSTTLEQSTFKYLGLNKNKEPIIRISYTEGGSEYIKLIVRPNSKGVLLVNDFFMASSGNLTSVEIANATKLLLTPSESVLKKLLGVKQVDETLAAKFKEVGKLRAQGKNKEAYDLILSFPEKLRNQREIILLSISLATFFDDNLYRRDLSNLDRLYSDDPKLAFMLVDHHFYEEDWPKAIAAIEISKKEWVDDGALNVILASAFYESKDFASAIKASEYAIEIEPDYEDAYWTAFTIYNAAGEFGKMIEMLEVLKNQFSYEFDANNFTEDLEYSAFVKSNEFKVWFK